MADTLAPPRHLTAEEFLERCADGRRSELIDGEEVPMPPAGDVHGRVGAVLWSLVSPHVTERQLGLMHTPDTGFLVNRNPDVVLAPDLSFTAAARVGPPERGFVPVVPDLVAETISPSELTRDVLAKVGRWLDAGVRVVWVLWPEQQRVHVWRSKTDCEVLDVAATLTCEELLPGLAIPLSDIFVSRWLGDVDG